MTQKEKKLLIVFAKNPVKGKVKTRLAASIGDRKALQIYHKLLEYTRYEVMKVQADRQIWYSEFIDGKDKWDPSWFAKRLQPEGNLGEKMMNAFDAGFKSGYEKIVLIGSDCPALLSEHIETAFEKLHTRDVVLGPSGDGGYYLIGLKKPNAALFMDKPWSTSSLYYQTVRELRNAGLGLYELEILNDIDTAEDLLSVNC